MMYGIKIWRNSNETYITSQQLQDTTGIGVELTHRMVEIAIQQINVNRTVCYMFKTDNYMYIKELEKAVNRRNKLNRLIELKDI